MKSCQLIEREQELLYAPHRVVFHIKSFHKNFLELFRWAQRVNSPYLLLTECTMDTVLRGVITMSIEECFWICWDEVEKAQWKNFSFERTVLSDPRLSMDVVLSYFPEKKEVLRFFLKTSSEKIPVYEGLSTKDVCFESVMARLEALSPHKKSALDVFLSSTGCEKRVLCEELYRYFSFHLQGADLSYPVCFYACALVGVYRLVFACWATESSEDVMIYLDTLLSKMLSLFE